MGSMPATGTCDRDGNWDDEGSIVLEDLMTANAIDGGKFLASFDDLKTEKSRSTKKKKSRRKLASSCPSLGLVENKPKSNKKGEKKAQWNRKSGRSSRNRTRSRERSGPSRHVSFSAEPPRDRNIETPQPVVPVVNASRNPHFLGSSLNCLSRPESTLSGGVQSLHSSFSAFTIDATDSTLPPNKQQTLRAAFTVVPSESGAFTAVPLAPSNNTPVPLLMGNSFNKVNTETHEKFTGPPTRSLSLDTEKLTRDDNGRSQPTKQRMGLNKANSAAALLALELHSSLELAGATRQIAKDYEVTRTVPSKALIKIEPEITSPVISANKKRNSSHRPTLLSPTRGVDMAKISGRSKSARYLLKFATFAPPLGSHDCDAEKNSIPPRRVQSLSSEFTRSTASVSTSTSAGRLSRRCHDSAGRFGLHHEDIVTAARVPGGRPEGSTTTVHTEQSQLQFDHMKSFKRTIDLIGRWKNKFKGEGHRKNGIMSTSAGLETHESKPERTRRLSKEGRRKHRKKSSRVPQSDDSLADAINAKEARLAEYLTKTPQHERKKLDNYWVEAFKRNYTKRRTSAVQASARIREEAI